MIDKIRVEFLAQKEIDYIFKILSKKEVKNKNKKLHKAVVKSLGNTKLIKANLKKENATKKANKVRIKASKKKIKTALKILKKERRTPTIANVATTAGIGYNTSKKYADMFGYAKFINVPSITPEQ